MLYDPGLATGFQLDRQVRELITEYGLEQCKLSFDRCIQEAVFDDDDPDPAAASNNDEENLNLSNHGSSATSRRRRSSLVGASSTRRRGSLSRAGMRNIMGFAVNKISHEKDEKIKVAMLDGAFDSMVCADSNGVIQMVNKATLKMFGYETNEEIIGKNVNVLVGGGHANHHDEYIANFKRTRKRELIGKPRDLEARRKDGTEFPCAVTIEVIELYDALYYVTTIRDRTKEQLAMELEIEKRAAENLLLNMLPKEIASRLKHNPSHMAEHHDGTTILFADIVGFTAMSSRIDAVELVRLLNDLFTRFDLLVDKYGLNKVKTIGDCYMVTSCPGVGDDAVSCASVCRFAFDMLSSLEAFNGQNPDRPLKLRIGINTGPVVAGVVGTKRFLYDLWGDAVNLASRMESTGIAGRIQVTKQVIDLLPALQFQSERRGLVQVKGKGSIETFFLNDRCNRRRISWDDANVGATSDNRHQTNGSKRGSRRRASCAVLQAKSEPLINLPNDISTPIRDNDEKCLSPRREQPLHDDGLGGGELESQKTAITDGNSSPIAIRKDKSKQLLKAPASKKRGTNLKRLTCDVPIDTMYFT